MSERAAAARGDEREPPAHERHSPAQERHSPAQERHSPAHERQSPAHKNLSPALDCYAELSDLADAGLQAALRGELAELEPLSERWDELVTSLPTQPPAAAGAMLERAALLNEATRCQLLDRHAALLREASVAERAGRAARGYTEQGSSRTRIERNA